MTTNRGGAEARRISVEEDSASPRLRGLTVRLLRAGTIVVALWLTVAGVHAGQRPTSLADVLLRLDSYLDRYATLLSTLVADERYVQSLQLTGSSVTTERVLRSDYALARSPGGHAWTGFRDTYEVDGEPVRDREERLLALIASGSADAARQALRISRDNARHNLGEDVVSRTINVPTVALDLIASRHRRRFSIDKRGEEVVAGVRAWVLSLSERDGPTLLRTPAGRDRRSRATVRIDPVSGAVLRTDLAWEGAPEGVVVVHYRRDEPIDALVPDVMLEEYRGASGLVTGKATYTNYRRFQTEARVVPNVR